MGYTGTSVLAEVLHRLMVAEAIERGLIRARGAVRKLKDHPEIIKQLNRYNEDVSQIGQMNLTILSLTRGLLDHSEGIRKSEGLLTNDSLVVAFMREHELKKLATNDVDFERVSDVDVYKPTDV